MVPAITGKVELVYEGEQEGYDCGAESGRQSYPVAVLNYFPTRTKFHQTKMKSCRKMVIADHRRKSLDLLKADSNLGMASPFSERTMEVVNEFQRDKDPATKLLLMEFALHGLSEYSLLSKHRLERGVQFKDLMSGMFNIAPGEEDVDDEDEESYGGRSN